MRRSTDRSKAMNKNNERPNWWDSDFGAYAGFSLMLVAMGLCIALVKWMETP